MDRRLLFAATGASRDAEIHLRDAEIITVRVTLY